MSPSADEHVVGQLGLGQDLELDPQCLIKHSGPTEDVGADQSGTACLGSRSIGHGASLEPGRNFLELCRGDVELQLGVGEGLVERRSCAEAFSGFYDPAHADSRRCIGG